MVAFYFRCSKNDDLRKCASLIDGGSIVIYPTDTVYGIGCNPLNKVSVLKLFHIKNRPLNKFMPILASNVSNLWDLVEITRDAEKLINRFWPGPLTLVLKIKKSSSLFYNRYEFDKTVAIRIPNNKCTTNLIQMTKDKLLIGTSANVSKQNPLIYIRDLNKSNLRGYDAVVDGDEHSTISLISYSSSCPSPFPSDESLNPTKSIIVSTIVDTAESNFPKIIREGAISKEEIFTVLRKEQ
jgi:L-threonylcarbamoyladenylate synthase